MIGLERSQISEYLLWAWLHLLLPTYKLNKEAHSPTKVVFRVCTYSAWLAIGGRRTKQRKVSAMGNRVKNGASISPLRPYQYYNIHWVQQSDGSGVLATRRLAWAYFPTLVTSRCLLCSILKSHRRPCSGSITTILSTSLFILIPFSQYPFRSLKEEHDWAIEQWLR